MSNSGLSDDDRELIRVLHDDTNGAQADCGFPTITDGGEAFDTLLEVGGDPDTRADLLRIGRDAFVRAWNALNS